MQPKFVRQGFLDIQKQNLILIRCFLNYIDLLR